MTTVYLSLGSNIEAEHNICVCLAYLQQAFGELTLSKTYQTPAVGFDGDDFLNLVVQFESQLPAMQIKQQCKAIEDQQGRQRIGEKFSARPIDIDVLLYGNAVLPALNIPHSDIEKYNFVLLPLLELTPEQIHPKTQQALKSLACELGFSTNTMQAVSLDYLKHQSHLNH